MSTFLIFFTRQLYALVEAMLWLLLGQCGTSMAWGLARWTVCLLMCLGVYLPAYLPAFLAAYLPAYMYTSLPSCLWQSNNNHNFPFVNNCLWQSMVKITPFEYAKCRNSQKTPSCSRKYVRVSLPQGSYLSRIY